VKALAQVCEEYVNRPIDFMKIDVEAHEYEVIVGGDWHRWRPRVVLVEAHWIERWELLLLAADYHFATFDGMNRYYVRGEDRQLLSAFATPIHVLDNYVPYRYLYRIEELGAELASAQAVIQELRAELATTKLVTNGLRAHGGPALYKDLGPNAIRVALGLHRVAARFPTISSTVKRITRLGA
jgi:Methyltransferase FkbM domain